MAWRSVVLVEGSAPLPATFDYAWPQLDIATETSRWAPGERLVGVMTPTQASTLNSVVPNAASPQLATPTRSSRPTRRAPLVRLVAPGMFLLLAAALIGGAIALVQQPSTSPTTALSVEGRAVVEDIMPVRSESGVVSGWTYELHFFTPDGQEITTTSREQIGSTPAYFQGDIADIRSDAADPTIVEVTAGETSEPNSKAAGILAALIGIVLAAVALGQLTAARPRVIDLR